jgi:hypothetical protein
VGGQGKRVLLERPGVFGGRLPELDTTMRY